MSTTSQYRFVKRYWLRHQWTLGVGMIAGIILAGGQYENASTYAQLPTNQAPDSKSETLRSQIEPVLMAQQAAWNQADIDGYVQGYWNSDQLTFASGGELTRGYKATSERYHRRYSTPQQMGQLSFSDLEYFELTDGAAYVLGKWALVRQAEQMVGNFTLVLRQIDGDWKIVHDHTSLLPKAEKNE